MALPLRCLSLVVLQQPAQPRRAADVGQSDRRRFVCFHSAFPRLAAWLDQQLVVLPLVRAHLVIMLRELRTEVVHVSLAKDDEVIKFFLLQALDEAFHEGHRVGRSKRRLLHFRLCLAERVIKRPAELVVAICASPQLPNGGSTREMGCRPTFG